MTFGIDLDGTYAADVPTFRAVVQLLQAVGHTCVLVTNRCEGDRPIVEKIVGGQMPIVFSCGLPKRAVAQTAGFIVNVWMDDNPILVDLGAKGLDLVGTY